MNLIFSRFTLRKSLLCRKFSKQKSKVCLAGCQGLQNAAKTRNFSIEVEDMFDLYCKTYILKVELLQQIRLRQTQHQQHVRKKLYTEKHEIKDVRLSGDK